MARRLLRPSLMAPFRALSWVSLVVSAALAIGCGTESDSNAGGGGNSGTGPGGQTVTNGNGPTGGNNATTGAAQTTGTTSGNPTAGSTSSTGGMGAVGRCGDPVPPGAETALPPPTYSGGSCPTLASGANDLGGRSFLLVLPTDYDATKSYPVVFLWHWLGGSAEDFFERAEAQAAADEQQFIAVIPQKKGDLLFVWPVESIQTQARVDEEARFFDDMLACVAEQYTVDINCVSSVGVSAGALWTDQLASERSERIASFVSLSGGTGGVIRPWKPAAHKAPSLVLWGGPTDDCIGLLSFQTLSGDLENALTSEGHFFLECIHNCGHSEPPFESPPGASKYKGMWDFVKDHPYWLPPGASIYQTEGIAPDLPEWCGIGKGSATARTGQCENASEC